MYEYLIQTINSNYSNIELNSLGKEGWELVGFNQNRFCFKRAIGKVKEASGVKSLRNKVARLEKEVKRLKDQIENEYGAGLEL